MKKLLSLVALCLVPCALSAATFTIYYSPSCPHCHNARKFINETLVKEYPGLKIVEVNVEERNNHVEFAEVIKKCNLSSGGVPIMVVGDKCDQGYGPSDVSDPIIRKNVEAVLAVEASGGAVEARLVKKNNMIWFYLILAAAVVGAGLWVSRKKRK